MVVNDFIKLAIRKKNPMGIEPRKLVVVVNFGPLTLDWRIPARIVYEWVTSSQYVLQVLSKNPLSLLTYPDLSASSAKIRTWIYVLECADDVSGVFRQDIWHNLLHLECFCQSLCFLNVCQNSVAIHCCKTNKSLNLWNAFFSPSSFNKNRYNVR